MFNTLPANPFPPSSEQMGAGGGGGSYVLPVASADTLGGVKVGNNLSIADGVLSAPAPYTPPAYSTTEQATGQKWIDGKDIYVITKTNVVPETVIVTNVDTIVDCVIARHGASDASKIKFFGDGFIQSDGGGINLDSGSASYVTWSGSGNVLERTADHVILYYTKTESEVN